MVAAVKAAGLDIPVIVGGIVPEVDVPKMHALGVTTILGPGTSAEDLVTAVRGAIDAA
jgi:methylmalonyl-CoA mutase C-terminal domain/subunit